jgi:hypothetical protein
MGGGSVWRGKQGLGRPHKKRRGCNAGSLHVHTRATTDGRFLLPSDARKADHMSKRRTRDDNHHVVQIYVCTQRHDAEVKRGCIWARAFNDKV